MARASEGHAGKAVELPPDDVAERVARQGVNRQQDYVEQEDESTGSQSDSSVKKESAERVAPKKKKEDEPNIQKITMEDLKNKRECGFAPIAVFSALADGASGRIEKKSPIVRLSVVIARDPKSQRPNQDQ